MADMLVRNIRRGSAVGGRRVTQVIDTFEPMRWKGRPAGTRPVRAVTFDDGSVVRFPADGTVDASGYVDPLPAGNVASKYVGTPRKTRASDGRWRGEGGDEHAGVRHLNFVSAVNMYDRNRVNGRVGIDN